MPKHRRLQATEAEIARPRHVGGIAIGMRNPRFRKRNRAIVAAPGPLVDDRTAGIAQPKQLGDLVIGFSAASSRVRPSSS
jgi:hypothetical protein